MWLYDCVIMWLCGCVVVWLCSLCGLRVLRETPESHAAETSGRDGLAVRDRLDSRGFAYQTMARDPDSPARSESLRGSSAIRTRNAVALDPPRCTQTILTHNDNRIPPPRQNVGDQISQVPERHLENFVDPMTGEGRKFSKSQKSWTWKNLVKVKVKVPKVGHQLVNPIIH